MKLSIISVRQYVYLMFCKSNNNKRLIEIVQNKRIASVQI